VDRQILESSVGLDARSARFLYHDSSLTRIPYASGTRPALEALAAEIEAPRGSAEGRVRAVARFLSGARNGESDEIEALRFGGIEEAIIARESTWCTDVSRAACALYQVMGLPSRMVLLADTEKAYSGHAVVEVYRACRWGAVDCVTGAVYATPAARPASTWDLMRNADWIGRAYRDPEERVARKGQFRAAAIASYAVGRRDARRYPVSRVSPYYRSILRMSERGWPGGLRWLHGEERRPN